MKCSAILVAPVVPLHDLPPHELDVVRRFLFQTMRGLDEEHSRRWRRMWARVAQGEILQLYPVVDRSLAFHRRHMAIEGRIFEDQDWFMPDAAGRRAFRLWLKTGAALLHLQLHGGEVDFIVGSLSYEDMSDDEMRSFHEAAMAFLRTPYALSVLWPVVRTDDRPQMLELSLKRPGQEPEDQQP